MNQPKSNAAEVMVITGQTATGKTAQAISLAREIGGELVNADARQIYRGLDIVTGKDRPPADIPLHLVDLLSPNESFSAHTYVEAAHPVLRSILKRGKTPIIVGGTYWYLKHLLYPLPHNPGPDHLLRAQLSQMPVAQLQAMLRSKSPAAFAALNQSDQANPHRLIRKIEIISQQGSEEDVNDSYEYDLSTKLGEPVQITMIGYRHTNRRSLEEAIELRVAKRINEGALDEVQRLLNTGFSGEEPGLSGIGYPQLIAYLRKVSNWENVITEWKTKEIQYAKRQYTFMKRDPNIAWHAV